MKLLKVWNSESGNRSSHSQCLLSIQSVRQSRFKVSVILSCLNLFNLQYDGFSSLHYLLAMMVTECWALKYRPGKNPQHNRNKDLFQPSHLLCRASGCKCSDAVWIFCFDLGTVTDSSQTQHTPMLLFMIFMDG